MPVFLAITSITAFRRSRVRSRLPRGPVAFNKTENEKFAGPPAVWVSSCKNVTGFQSSWMEASGKCSPMVSVHVNFPDSTSRSRSSWP